MAPARIEPSTSSISNTAWTKADTFDHYTTRAYTGLGGKVNILPQMLDLDKLANMGWFKHWYNMFCLYSMGLYVMLDVYKGILWLEYKYLLNLL